LGPTLEGSEIGKIKEGAIDDKSSIFQFMGDILGSEASSGIV
jgi:hypothetical protein